jgi:hypothetical protein
MQANLYRYWVKRIDAKQPIERTMASGVERVLVADAVWVESPFTELRSERLIGFADVAVRFAYINASRAPATTEWWWYFYELKPVIYSVGAVIRQCEATIINAKRAGFRNFDVLALVYEDDPKAALLKELHPLTIRTSRECKP